MKCSPARRSVCSAAVGSDGVAGIPACAGTSGDGSRRAAWWAWAWARTGAGTKADGGDWRGGGGAVCTSAARGGAWAGVATAAGGGTNPRGTTNATSTTNVTPTCNRRILSSFQQQHAAVPSGDGVSDHNEPDQYRYAVAHQGHTVVWPDRPRPALRSAGPTARIMENKEYRRPDTSGQRGYDPASGGDSD
ncbi:MAG: hypothetical protein MI924_37120 [Chloroflexales bacterium]|nr:hypothetical protein [Chloroflexales bacterium]